MRDLWGEIGPADRTRIAATLRPVELARAPALPWLARVELARLGDEIAREADDAEALARAAREDGCARLAFEVGSLGPFAHLDLDRAAAATARAPAAWRALTASGCHLDIPLSADGRPDARLLRAAIEVPAGDYEIAVEFSDEARLEIDGVAASVHGSARRYSPRLSAARVSLAAGRHELTLRIATAAGETRLGLFVLPLQGARRTPAVAFVDPRVARSPSHAAAPAVLRPELPAPRPATTPARRRARRVARLLRRLRRRSARRDRRGGDGARTSRGAAPVRRRAGAGRRDRARRSDPPGAVLARRRPPLPAPGGGRRSRARARLADAGRAGDGRRSPARRHGRRAPGRQRGPRLVGARAPAGPPARRARPRLRRRRRAGPGRRQERRRGGDAVPRARGAAARSRGASPAVARGVSERRAGALRGRHRRPGRPLSRARPDRRGDRASAAARSGSIPIATI